MVHLKQTAWNAGERERKMKLKEISIDEKYAKKLIADSEKEISCHIIESYITAIKELKDEIVELRNPEGRN